MKWFLEPKSWSIRATSKLLEMGVATLPENPKILKPSHWLWLQVAFDWGSYLFHTCETKGLMPSPSGSQRPPGAPAQPMFAGYVMPLNVTGALFRLYVILPVAASVNKPNRKAGEGTFLVMVVEFGKRKPS